MSSERSWWKVPWLTSAYLGCSNPHRGAYFLEQEVNWYLIRCCVSQSSHTWWLLWLGKVNLRRCIFPGNGQTYWNARALETVSVLTVRDPEPSKGQVLGHGRASGWEQVESHSHFIKALCHTECLTYDFSFKPHIKREGSEVWKE